MSLTTILVIVLILILVGGTAPLHAWSAGWGYGPSGILGLLLVVIVILALLGRL